MSKIKNRNISVLSLFILFSFVILSIGYSSEYKSEAQESSDKNQKKKSLRELAQERDVEIVSLRESEAEYNLETLARSEGIVQGRIIKAETTLTDNLLYTTYTIETQRIIKPFTSAAPLEAYQLLDKTPPEPIGAVFKITRPGGSLLVNGHRIIEKAAGQDELVENKNYIFFLSWSGDYKTYTLNGGISGAVLVQDDLQVKPLATRDDVRKSNNNFFKKGRNIGDFLQSLKKSKSN